VGTSEGLAEYHNKVNVGNGKLIPRGTSWPTEVLFSLTVLGTSRSEEKAERKKPQDRETENSDC
jgi:hypothetical protein